MRSVSTFNTSASSSVRTSGVAAGSGVDFCDERSFVFLALDLESVGPADPQGPEEQVMTVERVALADVPRMIQTGAIVDAKSIIGLTLARERLR